VEYARRRLWAEAVASLVLVGLTVLVSPLVGAASAGVPPFITSGVKVRTVPAGSLPFQTSRPMALAGDGLVDSHGVRMFSLYGRIWNHPVGQAQYALRSLDAYRLTGTQAYLDRAIANAQRLVDRRVVVTRPPVFGSYKPYMFTTSWFYPYPFNFLCCQGDTTMGLHAPWYSGMAQGEALSTFVRLFEATGDPAWRVAADATFASLLVEPSEDEPWVVWVDADSHLWLEEYPRWPEETSERVLNGHIYAAFGLYDYFELTADPVALRLFDGAVTTVEQLVPTKFRRVNWAMAYSLEHGLSDKAYQQRVISQLLDLHRITGRGVEAILADTLRSDFPLTTSRGTGKFTPSATRAYLLNTNRTIISSRSVTFTRPISAPVDRRERVASRVIMLRVAAGTWAGYWFREGVGVAWISGPVDVHDYTPTLTATFSPGSFDAYGFDTRGNRTGFQTVTVTTTTAWPTDGSAVVDGRLAYHFTSGPFAGFWTPAKSGLAVR
jgi:hypothetical protein